MLISWLHDQVKRVFIDDSEDRDFVLGMGVGLFIIGIMCTAAFGIGFPLIITLPVILVITCVVLFTVYALDFQPNIAPKCYLLYLISLYLYIGLIIGLETNIFPLGLPLFGTIIAGEEAIFWIDPQKRPKGVNVLKFTALKKLDALNDVFIGLGIFGLVYEVGELTSPSTGFLVAEAPLVGAGIAIIGGALILLLLNSLKYGGPFASESKLDSKP